MMTKPSAEALLEYVIEVDKLTGVHALVLKDFARLKNEGSDPAVHVRFHAPFGFLIRPTSMSLCHFDFVPFEEPTKALGCPMLVQPIANKDGVPGLMFQVSESCFTLEARSVPVDVTLDLELWSDRKPIDFERLHLRQVHHDETGQSVHLHLFFTTDSVESANKASIGAIVHVVNSRMTSLRAGNDGNLFAFKDVELVSCQGDCSYEAACAALRATKGDVVAAIVQLTESVFEPAKATSTLLGKQDVTDSSKLACIDEPPTVPQQEQPPIDGRILDSSDDEDESDSDDDDDSSEDGSLVEARDFLKDFIFTVYTRVMQFKHVHSLGLVGDNEADASKWDIFTRCVAEDFDVEEEDGIGTARCYRAYLQQFDTVHFFNTWCSQNNVTLSMLVFAEEFALRLCTHPIAGMFVSRVQGEGVFEAPSRQIADAFEKLLAVHPTFCYSK